MRITLDCARDLNGRLAGTVCGEGEAGHAALPFSGIVELVERIEEIEESSPRTPAPAGPAA